MKKSVALLVCVALVISLCGCGGRLLLLSKEIAEERKAFSDAVTALTTALDNGDEEAIYNLFSPAVRDDNDDLREKVSELVSTYAGPTEKIGNIELCHSSYESDEGRIKKSVDNTFPVYAGGKLYWINLDVMYENSYKRIEGVTQLDFYSAADYYEAYHSIEYDYNEGINIHNTDEDSAVVSVNNFPQKIIEDRVLDLNEVKDFLKNSRSIKEFKKQFGEPTLAENEENGCIYLLPEEKGEKRYLEMFFEKGEIHSAWIQDSFSEVEPLIEIEECVREKNPFLDVIEKLSDVYYNISQTRQTQ